MQFKFDRNKSASNKVKHGIDFDEAQELWNDAHVTVELGSGHGEERQAAFGLINGKHWTVITTLREGNIRIISARRSRKAEEDYYDSETQH